MITNFKIFETHRDKVDPNQIYLLRAHDNFPMDVVGKISLPSDNGPGDILSGYVLRSGTLHGVLYYPVGYFFDNRISLCGRDWNYLRKARPEEIDDYNYYLNGGIGNRRNINFSPVDPYGEEDW